MKTEPTVTVELTLEQGHVLGSILFNRARYLVQGEPSDYAEKELDTIHEILSRLTPAWAKAK